jgi:hypothetical protein
MNGNPSNNDKKSWQIRKLNVQWIFLAYMLSHIQNKAFLKTESTEKKEMEPRIYGCHGFRYI